MRLSTFCACVLSFVCYAVAQPPKFSANVNVVNILANVFDKRGSLVQNLSKADFVLEEDGQPQTIQYFSKQTELPLTLGLLVDTSGSMSRMFEEERSASAVFFQEVLRPKRDRVFLMNFDEQVRIVQPLTSSRRQLDNSLKRLEPDMFRIPLRMSGTAFSPDGRSTALFDAIYVASEALMKNQQGRKALIVISDGMDVKSENTLDEAIAAAQKADAIIYAIRIFDSGIPSLLGAKVSTDALDSGKQALEQLSRETGGTFFEATEAASISEIYSKIENELRSQYSLGYTPSDVSLATAGFHKLHVSTRCSVLTVQARNGYYTNAR